MRNLLSAGNLLKFVRLSRPHFLLGGILLYGLGAAIAAYLGNPIDVGAYLLGQAVVTAIQLGAQYLNEYYDINSDLLNQSRTLFSGGSGALGGEDGLHRAVALYAGIGCLTFAATVASILMASIGLSLAAGAILVLAAILSIGYSVPPVRLVTTGYGEIAAAFVVGGLVPGFSYSLQVGELHRLLLMSTVPLVSLLFAAIIVFELPDYAADLKAGKNSLLVRVGWQTAMRLHDAAIAFAFLSLLMAFGMGLPRRVVLGTLITLPLGIAQVWMLWRIRQGAPPRWNLLTTSAILLFSLAAYLQLAGYWLS